MSAHNPGRAAGGPAPRFTHTPCEGNDELFFPPRGNSATKAVKEAKELCHTCSVEASCLEYALTAQGVPGRWVEGVWGGTTSAQRDQIRAARRKTTTTHPDTETAAA